MSEEEITDIEEDGVVLDEENSVAEELLPFDIADESGELDHSLFGGSRDEE